MKKKLIEIFLTGIIVFLVGGFLFTTLGPYLAKRRIREKMVIAQGAVVTKIERLPKSIDVYSVRFTFIENGEEINCQIKNSYQSTKGIKSRKFPVVYQRSNVRNAFILIKPDDFDSFNMQFPDSLSTTEIR